MRGVQLSHVGTRASDGRRLYVYAHKPLAFAVYAKLHTKDPSHRRHGVLELVARVFDCEHRDETIWDPGSRSWVKTDRALTPAEKAEQLAIWWREVGNTEAEVVALQPTRRIEGKHGL